MTDAPAKKTGFSPRKKGPPKITLDPAQIEALAALQCTMEEIASGVGISADTLTRRCADDTKIADAIKRGRQLGTRSLRRMQYESAQKGNVIMQIFLGKQWLGQRDQASIQLSDPKQTLLILMPGAQLPEDNADADNPGAGATE